DVDDESLALARAGRFPWVAGPEEARVRHFLVAGPRGLYQVDMALRDGDVFAPHELLSQLPFPPIDLIFCALVRKHLQPAAPRRGALRRGVVGLGAARRGAPRPVTGGAPRRGGGRTRGGVEAGGGFRAAGGPPPFVQVGGAPHRRERCGRNPIADSAVARRA